MMIEPPALSPFLQRLATRLLAKAERSTGSVAVRLKLDGREAHELYGQTDAEAVQRWVMHLQDLCATGWVSLKLAPSKEFSGFVDRNPQLELHDFDALAAWAGYTPQASRWQRQWLDYLAARWKAPGMDVPPDPEALLDYLARNPLLALQELPMDVAARSLEALRALCASGLELSLREASAQVFQGRSKILDSREELLRLLGAASGQFHEAPIQLLVALPDEQGVSNEVLFVENLVTFERMADLRQPSWRHSLLVYAAGFRGSAQRLHSRHGCRIYVRAPSSVSDAMVGEGRLCAIENWLFDGLDLPVYFLATSITQACRFWAVCAKCSPVPRPGSQAIACWLMLWSSVMATRLASLPRNCR